MKKLSAKTQQMKFNFGHSPAGIASRRDTATANICTQRSFFTAAVKNLLPLSFVGLLLITLTGILAAQNVKDSDNKVDKNLKSVARVNPSTLAMEFSLPMADYPGRNGNSLPVGITYSSKLWRLRPNLTWRDTHDFYHTDTTALYAERSAAGWTSSLRPPHIVEKLELYNINGSPMVSLLLEQELVDLYSGQQSNAIEFCTRRCLSWMHPTQHLVCNIWSSWSCVRLDFPGGGGGGGGETPTPPTPYKIARLRVEMPDGSSHEFRKDDSLYQHCTNTSDAGCNTELLKTGTFLSVDGSRMRLERGVSYGNNETRDILYLPDGSKYIFPTTFQNGTDQGIFTAAEKYVDASGNQTQFDVATNTWTDTMGRQMKDILPQNWHEQNQDADLKRVSLPAIGTGKLDYDFNWEKLEDVFDADLPVEERTLNYAGRDTCASNLDGTVSPALFGGSDRTRVCSYQADDPGSTARFNPIVLEKIILPNGKTYEFKYNRYGEITKIKYPAGMTEKFEYGTVPPVGTESVSVYDQTNRGVRKRWIYNAAGELQQTWKYDAVRDTSYQNPEYIITTTAPDNTVSKRFLHYAPYPSSRFGFEDTRNGMAKDERVYSPANQMLRRSLTEWTQTDSLASGNPSAKRDPRPLRSISIIIEGNKALAQMSESVYENPATVAIENDPSYFARLNVKQSKTYHYQPIDKYTAENGSFAQIAAHFTNATPATIGETQYLYDPNYKARGISSLPVETRTLNPANNLVIAKSQTVYDNAVPAPDSDYPYAITEDYSLGSSLECPTASGQPKICWQHPGNSLRGNPTTARVWNKDEDTWIETHTRYDIFGNAITFKDPAGNEAKTFFENTPEKPYLYAYPTKAVAPAPDPGGTYGTSDTSQTTTVYDFNTGLPTTVTDDFGQKTETIYDAFLRPIRTQGSNFVAPIIETIYNDDALTITTRKQIDANNWDETESHANSLGQIVKTRAKDSQGDVFVETKYDNMGRVVEVTNPYRSGEDKLWSKTVYDELGRVKESFAPAPVPNPNNQGGYSLGTTSYDLAVAGDSIGTVVETSDASGRKGRAVTNALGQLIRVDEPSSTNTLNPLPAPTATPLPTPSPTPGGNCYEMLQPDPNCQNNLINNDYDSVSTYYKYDALGKMVMVTQGAQKRYFKYDSLGRLIRLKQPEQEANPSLNLADDYNTAGAWSAGFVYDIFGNVKRTTDANGVNIIYEYDKASRLVKRCYTKPNVTTTASECSQILNSNLLSTDTPTVENFYDGKGLDQPQSPNYAKGKLTKVTSPVSESRYKLFDNLGRLTEMEQRTPVGAETLAQAVPRVSSYQYNLSGALVQETYPSGRVVRNEFEEDGDLARIYGKANQNAAERTYANGFSYAVDGRIQRLRLGNGRWESARFNDRLQVTELALGTSDGNGSLWKLNYEYGELKPDGTVNANKNTGNIARQTLSFNGLAQPLVQTYKYDSLYRLTEAKETTGSGSSGNQNWIQNFAYDRFGNRTGLNQTGNGFPVSQTPTIDPGTNRFVTAGQSFVYDKTGNLVTDGENRQFAFNGDNKQTEVKNAAGVVVGRYYYDGEGKRVKKKAYEADGITVREETVFVYSTGKLVAEYSTQPPSQNPTTSYTATDHLGSPRVITDANGQVTSRRDFMPFGEELNPDGSYRKSADFKYGQTDSVRQRFTGYQKDAETNLDFAEARMYENRHGRFTAVDPLLASGKSANPQTFNRFVYCLNNPLAYTDPDGLQVASHYGTVYRRQTETRTEFGRSPFEGATVYEGAEYFDADDGFTYNISTNGFYSIGKTSEILARGENYSVADSLRRMEAYLNSSLPSTWIPEMMIDPPGYKEASRTSGGRFTIADGETDYKAFIRQSDEQRAFGIAMTVTGTLGGTLGNSGAPPKIGNSKGNFSNALQSKIANTFRFKKYEEITLEEPLILGRYYDNKNSFANGAFMSPLSSITGNRFLDRFRLAIRPEWNNMTKIAYWEIAPGSTVYKGKAGMQFPYFGGRTQYFVPRTVNKRRVIKP